MDLDQQIQVLIDHAPQDGTTPRVIEAIAPVLKLIAGQLKHSQYYILQTLDQSWVMTTLSNRAQPDVEKNVIYAFPTLKDAQPYAQQDPQVMALPVPVAHILFQMVAMDMVSSTVFFELSGNLAAGTEVRREDLQNLINTQLQHSQGVIPHQPLPPDIA
jgi:hypothetical protein